MNKKLIKQTIQEDIKELGLKKGDIIYKEEKLEEDIDTLKDFSRNIKNNMMAIKNNEGKSGDYKLFLQYAMEANLELPDIRNFFNNISDILKKIKNNKKLTDDENNTIVQFYLEVLANL